jgi:antitoxin component YwqK of YwqJK toxin-antitoxin module
MNFNYKIGCVYFGAGDIDNAINFLNKITNQVIPNFREDIQCYARILNLIAHFELGNDLLVSYQIKSTYRFLLKAKENSKVLDEIFSFLRKTPRMLESELKSEFEALKEKLEEIEKEKYERRPFLYLDIISWLDSKIHNRSMAESIRLCKGISETDRLELLAV